MFLNKLIKYFDTSYLGTTNTLLILQIFDFGSLGFYKMVVSSTFPYGPLGDVLLENKRSTWSIALYFLWMRLKLEETKPAHNVTEED